MASSFRTFLPALILLGCSPTRAVDPDTHVARRIGELAAIDPRLSDVLRARTTGLDRHGDAFASSAFRAAHVDPSHLGASFPASADGAIRLGPGLAESWAVRLTPVDARAAQGSMDAGRALWTEVWPSTDVIATSDARSAEWFLVLRDDKAPTQFRWKVTLGSGLEPRTRDGAIELLDERGDPALRIDAPWAVDAKGKRHDVRMVLEEGELRLTVDTRDAALPLVVDPLASVPVWTLKTSGTFVGRAGSALAYTTNGPVLFGGEIATNTYSNEAFQFNGSTWVDIADPTSSPQVSTTGTTWKSKFLTFGGCNGTNCVTEQSQAWSFDGTSWSAFCGGSAVSCGATARSGHMMAATNLQLMILGGLAKDDTPPFLNHYMGDGKDGAGFDFADVWLLESTATTNTFVKYTPTGSRPTARANGAMAGSDSTILLFGGRNDWSGFLGDTWLWTRTGANTGSWTCVCGCVDSAGALQVCPSAPGPRAGAGLTYDSARKRFVMYGGMTYFGSTADGNDDTWDFDPATKTWTQLCGGGGASCGTPRNQGPLLAYDPVRRRVVETAGTQGGARLAATYELYVRGGSCSTALDCDVNGGGTTSYCSESTCCEVSNCPQCQTCASATSPGKCANIPAGEPDTRSGYACAACDGAGACKKALGNTCAASNECASGFCVDSVCCGVSTCASGYTCAPGGSCKKKLGESCGSSSDCGPGFCTDGVCCGSASCGTGSRCDSAAKPGVCAKSAGQTCTANSDCGTGFCADGVCCNSACSGQCAACDVAGNVGTCIAVVGTPHGSRTACSGSGSCAARCNGTDATACHYPDATSTCGSPSCASGVQTAAGYCDGAGGCKQVSASCGVYSCKGTSCGTVCTTSSECATGNYCKSGVCAPKEPAGVACTSSASCATGFCVDGVCCGTAACADGARCDVVGALGKCSKPIGTKCTATADCGGGHCVDGVCCDTACNGQCEACDVAGSEGVCTPVVGAPRGTRTTCDSLTTNDCARKACDGTVRDKCNGFANGASTSCGADACTEDKQFQKHGSCDGKGSCVLPDSKPCTPFACDATASSGCKASCATAADCAEGFACEAGACVQGARCSDDGLSSIAKTGESTTCAPYRCGGDGNCLKACAGSSDCVAGTVCDTTVKACVVAAAAAAPEEASGCATGRSSSGSSAWFLGLALAALSLRRARATHR